MNQDDLTDILQILDKNTYLTTKIDHNIDEINRKFDKLPKDLVETFRKYTLPQNNIEQLIKFYKTAINTIESIEKTEKSMNEDTKESSVKQQIHSITCHNKIKGLLELLDGYKDIAIVRKYWIETENKLKKTKDPVFSVFFKNFLSEKKDLQILSFFLIANDEKNFMQKYCKVLLHKYCIGRSKKETSFVLEKLLNVENVFNEIMSINELYLDEKNSEILYKELRQLILIDLKEAVSKVLIEFENKFKFENIMEACKFYMQLQEPVTQEYFKALDKELLKIMNNLFVTFFTEISKIKKPNKKYLHEPFVHIFNQILHIFKENKMKNLFMQLRKILEFQNHAQMRIRLGTMACERIIEISTVLKGIQKNVYLLNNFTIIHFYCHEYNDIAISDYIIKFSDEIVKMWDKECEKKKKKDVTRFLDVNLEIQKQYYLSEELREGIVPRIRIIIENLVRNSEYKGEKGTIKKRIKDLFSYGGEENQLVSEDDESLERRHEVLVEERKKNEKNESESYVTEEEKSEKVKSK